MLRLKQHVERVTEMTGRPTVMVDVVGTVAAAALGNSKLISAVDCSSSICLLSCTCKCLAAQLQDIRSTSFCHRQRIGRTDLVQIA